jgi:1-acyl-sn-glycerol-3-phosphate acyltransferase
VRYLAYMASRLLTKILLAPVVSSSVVRADATSRPGPWILAANHISHFDPPLIGVAARRKVDWMAMVELFEHPVAAAWLRGIDSFPVDRAKVDRQAVRTALDRLKQGHVVGLFPEGGIRDGEHSVLEGAPMRPGVGALAQMSRAPVLPCVIVGSDRLYAKEHWLRPRRTPIWISFGEEMRYTGSGKEARQKFEQHLAEALRRLYAEMQEQFGLTGEDLPQPPMRRKGRQ